MLFAVLVLTVVAAATPAGTAQSLLETNEPVSLPPARPTGIPAASAAGNSALSLRGRALAITAGADTCNKRSTGLPAAECSAWQELYDETGGTDVAMIERCALSRPTD